MSRTDSHSATGNGLMQLLMGAWMAQALGAAAKLGIADHLADGAKSSGDLAQLVGAHAPSLRRLMRMLASAGVFAESEPDHFTLTRIGQGLRSGIPGSLREFAISQTDHAHWNAWGRFTEALQTGAPQCETAIGCDLWTYYSHYSDAAAAFSTSMANISAMIIPAILRAYDFSKARTVVDIGGGRGQLLAGVLRTYPHVKGVLFDLPYATRDASSFLATQGVVDRVEIETGSFLQKAAPAGDLYLIKNVLHDYDDTRCIEFLKNLRAGMRLGSRALVIEMLVPEGTGPSLVHGMDLNMMVVLGGKERTVGEFKALFATAGLRCERVLGTLSLVAILEVSRAD